MWQRALGFFRANGYEIAKEVERCDAVVLNTCCVTQGRIQQAKETVDKVRRKNPQARIVLFGCLAALEDDGGLGADVIRIGPHDTAELQVHFPHRIPLADSVCGSLGGEALCPYQQRVNNRDSFVLIAQGCVNNCSYCNIKRAKGYVASVPAHAICGAIKEGLAHGRQEFVLLADDCGSYGKDTGTNLLDLLREIRSLDDRVQVKLHSVFPSAFVDMAEEMIDLAADGLISYANIPLQSGAPRILEMMNRSYDIRAVSDLIRELKAKAPKVWLHSHFIVGFPSETEDEFAASLDLVTLFDEVLFLAYSDNPGTRAAGFEPKIAASVTQQRLEKVKRRFPGPEVTIVTNL